MGFENKSGSGGNAKFANFKEGVIVTKINGERRSFTHLCGDILDVEVEDAVFDNKPYRKIILYIQHEDGVTMLGFPLGSGYGVAFCKICPNIDVNKPVEVSGGFEKPEGYRTGFGKIFVSQGEKYVQHFYSAKLKNLDKIPDVKEVKVGKNMVKDYTKRDEFFEKVLFGFHTKLQKVWPNGAAISTKTKKAAAAEDVVDDLPF